jgi:CHAT domain-containing protein
MIRSGLILSGANSSWQQVDPRIADEEDGILTAYEISLLDLSNTDLVVLSACETGLGEVQGSEGVYGLQRAFKIAGVKNIIMSLWQVPDKQTAQKTMRDKKLEPYYWAGFVLME